MSANWGDDVRSESYLASEQRTRPPHNRNGKWLLLPRYAIVWKVLLDTWVKCHTKCRHCRVTCHASFDCSMPVCYIKSHTGAVLCCRCFVRWKKNKAANRTIFAVAVLHNLCLKRAFDCFAAQARCGTNPMSCSIYMCDINQQECTKRLFASADRSYGCFGAETGKAWACATFIFVSFFPSWTLYAVFMRKTALSPCWTHWLVRLQRGAFINGYWHVIF